MEKLIYDRTQSDVNNHTSKGYWNVEDIDRINDYIEYLSDELNLGLNITRLGLGVRLDNSYLSDILSNVESIRNAWYVAHDTPNTPVAIGTITWKQANDIERILQDVYDFLMSYKIDKVYSGSFRAGSQIKFRGA